MLPPLNCLSNREGLLGSWPVHLVTLPSICAEEGPMSVIKTAHLVKNLKNAAFVKEFGLFPRVVCVLVSKAVLWGSVHVLFLPPHLSLDPPSLDPRVPRLFHPGLWWDGEGGASLFSAQKSTELQLLCLVFGLLGRKRQSRLRPHSVLDSHNCSSNS